MVAKKRAKKTVDDTPVKEPVVEPSPFVEGLEPSLTPPTPGPTAAQQKAADKAAEQAALSAKKSAAATAVADEKRRKDEAGRTVLVRAIRRGQYPADGKIRNPGDVFDYVLHKLSDGTLEEKLPSWVVHVDGDMESRVPGEPSAPPEEATVIEVRGTGANASVTSRPGPKSRSVL